MYVLIDKDEAFFEKVWIFITNLLYVRTNFPKRIIPTTSAWRALKKVNKQLFISIGQDMKKKAYTSSIERKYNSWPEVSYIYYSIVHNVYKYFLKVFTNLFYVMCGYDNGSWDLSGRWKMEEMVPNTLAKQK